MTQKVKCEYCLREVEVEVKNIKSNRKFCSEACYKAMKIVNAQQKKKTKKEKVENKKNIIAENAEAIKNGMTYGQYQAYKYQQDCKKARELNMTYEEYMSKNDLKGV